MVENLKNSDELLIAVNEFGLYKALVDQIKRDFERAGISIAIDSDTPQDKLKEILREKIYVLLLEHYEDFNQLLYTIDVSEAQFKKLKPKDVVDLSGNVFFLILKRELQKVWYRKKTLE